MTRTEKITTPTLAHLAPTIQRLVAQGEKEEEVLLRISDAVNCNDIQETFALAKILIGNLDRENSSKQGLKLQTESSSAFLEP